jgi:hypothetical protein
METFLLFFSQKYVDRQGSRVGKFPFSRREKHFGVKKARMSRILYKDSVSDSSA